MAFTSQGEIKIKESRCKSPIRRAIHHWVVPGAQEHRGSVLLAGDAGRVRAPGVGAVAPEGAGGAGWREIRASGSFSRARHAKPSHGTGRPYGAGLGGPRCKKGVQGGCKRGRGEDAKGGERRMQ